MFRPELRQVPVFSKVMSSSAVVGQQGENVLTEHNFSVFDDIGWYHLKSCGYCQ